MEKWKDINGYEGLYKISNYGNVYSYPRHKTNGGILKPQLRNGYLRVKLFKNGKEKNICVHQLVAQAFVPNEKNKNCINHKDGNKRNNNADNLEWCSYAENVNHAYENGLRKTKKIAQIKNGKIIKTYLNICRASKETNIDYASIYWCVNGRYKQAGGYKWIFLL